MVPLLSHRVSHIDILARLQILTSSRHEIIENFTPKKKIYHFEKLVLGRNANMSTVNVFGVSLMKLFQYWFLNVNLKTIHILTGHD